MNLEILQETPPWDWPPNAGEIIKKTLRDRRAAASARIIAADLAGDLIVMDDPMAGLLLTLLRNTGESQELRARAAISFGAALEEVDIEGFDDELSDPSISEEMFDQIQETLHKVHADGGEPKEVRRRVLEASVRAPQDWHADAVRAAFSSGDEDWKLTATFCTRWIPGFDKEILEMIKSENPDIHYEAILAAGEREVSAAWPHVEALLTSRATEKRLLLAAIEAVGTIHPGEAIELLAKLSDSKDEEIAEAASEAMAILAGGDDEEDEDFDEDGEDDEDAPF